LKLLSEKKEGNETQSDLLQQIRKIIFPKFQPQDLPNSKIDSSSMKTLAELKDKLTLDPLEFNSELAFTQMLKDNDIAIGDFVIDSNIKKGKILGLLQAVRSYYSVLEEKEKNSSNYSRNNSAFCSSGDLQKYDQRKTK